MSKPTQRNVAQSIEKGIEGFIKLFKQSVEEGNQKRLTIQNKEGKVLFDTTLTLGVVILVFVLIGGWWVLILAGILGVLGNYRLAVVNSNSVPNIVQEPKSKPETPHTEE
ncbi:MAG: DUF4342 domain-containing protein [Phototrophicaceae bacterium]